MLQILCGRERGGHFAAVACPGMQYGDLLGVRRTRELPGAPQAALRVWQPPVRPRVAAPRTCRERFLRRCQFDRVLQGAQNSAHAVLQAGVSQGGPAC